MFGTDEAGEAPPEDMLNILLATDIHLGYNEKDPIRGDDSFNTFEEILQLGARREVDFILLGGDLFHDNKPSMKCIHRCMALIRKYCLGDKPVAIEFVSDQSLNFSHCVNPVVNYEDPNLNISIPIFSIHGNHDDPSGFGRTCSLDLLSTTGLVNYFGKCNDLAQLEISPILMAKGETQLAIYGLSYIKDERLARLFRDKKVSMHRPHGEEVDWFNIFVLHQNRADRGVFNYLTEDSLPDFLDLVFWGHEHECRIKPEKSPRRNFFVTQPGSPVATSLSEGEAEPKHVGILHVYKKNFQLEVLMLETVRPFVFDRIVLSKCTLPAGTKNTKTSENVQNYVTDYVSSMLEKVDEMLTGHPKQPTLPLIRLRVDYTDESQMFNTIRFGQAMADRVANPTDMILLRRELVRERRANGEGKLDREAMDAALKLEDPQALWASRVEKVVENYFNSEELDEKKILNVLSVKGLGEAVMQFVDKDDKDAISDIVTVQIARTVQYLKENNVNDNNICEDMETFRLLRAANPDEEANEARQTLTSVSRSQKRSIATTPKNGDASRALVDSIKSDSDDDYVAAAKPAARGRSSRGGRGSRAQNVEPKPKPAARGRGRGRGAKDAKEVQPTLDETFRFTTTRRAPARSSHSQKNKGAVYEISDSD